MQVSAKERRGVTCPQCGRGMPLSKALFREDFRCILCQVPLYVSVAYSRTLVLLSMITSLALLWTLGIRNLLLLLFLPLGFVVLTIMVRLAPLVVSPRVYMGKPSTMTKLDLSK
jgi:hypothetical protein